MTLWTTASVNCPTVRSAFAGVGAALLAGSAACGVVEPLAGIEASIQRNLDDDRPPSVGDPAEGAGEDALELGVLWLRGTGDGHVRIEGARLDELDVSLQATITTNLFDPPSANIGGNIQLYGPEHPIVTPDRVGAGVVVAAPVGVLAELPSVVAWSDFAGGETEAALNLARLTHVSSLLVLHVRDAQADGLTLADGQAVPEFQLIDATGFVHQTRLGICFDEIAGPYWESDEVQTCIAEATEARGDALAAEALAYEQCVAGCAGADAQEACNSSCMTHHNLKQVIDNTCLESVAYPVARAACGEDHVGPMFGFLDPSLSATIDLGSDDIRDVVAHSGFLYFSF